VFVENGLLRMRAQERSVKGGKETKTFVPGTISWRVQVVNQDGMAYRDAKVTT
jgi:hypothetical protein